MVLCHSDDSRMAHIERAKFNMGGEEDDDQQPIHETEISDYLIDIHPVGNAQYQKFYRRRWLLRIRVIGVRKDGTGGAKTISNPRCFGNNHN